MILFSSGAIAAEPQCNSAFNIYKNMDACDGLNVVLTGTVANIEYHISSKNNEYTTFSLDDSTATPLKVFSYTALPIADGDVVKVSGKFTKVSRVGNYTFSEQITTSPENVFVVKETVANKVLPAVAVIFIVAVIFVMYEWHKRRKSTDEERKEMGTSFENYVQSLFDQKDWLIVDRTKDLSKTLGRRVESDSNPDFIFKHKDTGKIVAIECKYRSDFALGKSGHGICWTAGDYQIKKYNEFSEKAGFPVFAAIGIGGIPSNPHQLFLTPLYALKYRWASKDYLERFERSVKSQVTLEELRKYHDYYRNLRR